MKVTRTCVLVCLFVCTLVALSLNAQLIPNPDGKTVYDVAFQANWAANANLAGTEEGKFGVAGINQKGSMDFRTVQLWLETLNGVYGGDPYLKHADWQLPATPKVDDSCHAFGPNANSFGYGCKRSAMGNLYNVYFHDDFQISWPDTAVPIPTISVGPFTNFQPYLYWSKDRSGDPSDPTNDGYHTFSFNTGFGGANVKHHYMYVLPMIPYQVAGTYHASGIPGLLVHDTLPVVWDEGAKVTWLADADLAKTQWFGAQSLTGDGVMAINADGSMSRATADAWITGMNAYDNGPGNHPGWLGLSDWDLPPIIDFTDCTLGHLGFDCDHNPMGELFYGPLNLSQGKPVVDAPNINLHGFTHLQPYLYWACTLADGSKNVCSDDLPATGFAWTFSFGNGFEGTDVIGNNMYAMIYYPATPAQVLAEGINEYLGDSPELNAFLVQAADISASPNDNAKAGRLGAFVNHVNTQRGNGLTSAQADYLIALAQVI